MALPAALLAAIEKSNAGVPSWLNNADPSIQAAVNQYRAPAISGAAPSGSGWQVPGMSPTTVNGLTYQSNVTPTGQGENWDGSYTPWTETYYYDPNHQDIGDPFKAINHQTGVTDARAFQDPTPTSDILTPLMFALGVGAFAPGGFAAGAGGGAAGGGVAGVGDAGWGMGLDSVTGGSGALGFGGAEAAGPGMAGWGADLGGAGELAGSSAPGWTSAAADSQLANLGIAEAGGNPLTGYLGSGGVTASPMAGSGGSWLDSLLGSGGSETGGAGGTNVGMLGKGLGLASTLVGGAAGGQGSGASGSQSKSLDPRLDGPVFGDLVPRAQGLLGQQMPIAQQQGAQMGAVGSGLLGTPMTGNGYGKVTLDQPNTPTNPYLTGMADDMQRRTKELVDGSLLGIQGNSVATGGLGGSRQGVAQSGAIKGAADSLQGQLAGLYGTAYNADQSRALQKYGLDQNFYQGQRGQDLTSVGMGADLMNAGTNMQWSPIKNAASTYSPFSGYGTTTTQGNEGGGWQGILGGLAGGAKFGKDMGWWG